MNTTYLLVVDVEHDGQAVAPSAEQLSLALEYSTAAKWLAERLGYVQASLKATAISRDDLRQATADAWPMEQIIRKGGVS